MQLYLLRVTRRKVRRCGTATEGRTTTIERTAIVYMYTDNPSVRQVAPLTDHTLQSTATHESSRRTHTSTCCVRYGMGQSVMPGEL